MSNPVPFGRVPASILESGALAEMSPSALRVYVAICARWRSASWSCWPSIETLIADTGLSRSSVYEARAELVRIGALEMGRRGGGRGRRTTYRPPGAPEPRPELFGGSAAAAAFFPLIGGESGELDRFGEKGSGELDPLRAVLVEAGIAEPALSELAKHPGLSVDIAKRVIEIDQDRGKGPGVHVLNLRARAAQNLAALEKLARAAESDQAREAEDRRAQEEADREHKARMEAFRALPDHTIEEIVEEAIRRFPRFEAPIREADPRTSDFVGAMLAEIAEEIT